MLSWHKCGVDRCCALFAALGRCATSHLCQLNIKQRDYSRRRLHGRRMPKSRAIKGIDEDMKLNKALWQMAEILCARGTQ
jgi:hypothetical protein